MGCLVNGPGESKHVDVGISLPGFRESSTALVFIDGEKHKVLRAENLENNQNIVDEFFQIIEEYVARRYY